MKLSSESRIVRWAYWLDDPPSRTDLCRFFWRVVLLTPFKLFCAAIIVPCGCLGWLIYKTGQAIKAGWRRLSRATRPARRKEYRVKQPSVAIQRIKDWKSKTCTLIEIE